MLVLGRMNILDALRRTRELVEMSKDSAWSTSPTGKIAAKIDSLMRSVETGKRPKFRLGLLFAATGDLQEISIANGWGDEFLKLAEAVDAYIQKEV
jgi:hypothetical protein